MSGGLLKSDFAKDWPEGHGRQDQRALNRLDQAAAMRSSCAGCAARAENVAVGLLTAMFLTFLLQIVSRYVLNCRSAGRSSSA